MRACCMSSEHSSRMKQAASGCRVPLSRKWPTWRSTIGIGPYFAAIFWWLNEVEMVRMVEHDWTGGIRRAQMILGDLRPLSPFGSFGSFYAPLALQTRKLSRWIKSAPRHRIIPFDSISSPDWRLAVSMHAGVVLSCFVWLIYNDNPYTKYSRVKTMLLTSTDTVQTYESSAPQGLRRSCDAKLDFRLSCHAIWIWLILILPPSALYIYMIINYICIQNTVELWTVELNSPSALPTVSSNGSNSIWCIWDIRHTAKTIQDNALSRQIRQGGRCSDAMAAMVLAEPPSAKLFHTDVSCQRCGPCDWSKPVRSFSTVLALPQGAFARGATIAEDAWRLPVVRLPPWRIASQTWNWAKQFRLQCGPDAFKAPPRLCVEPIFWTLELAST